MTISRKLALFLHKLAARHISENGTIARSLLGMYEGRGSGIEASYCPYVPDDKMKFTAHLLCTLGQETEGDTAAMLVRACSVAIEQATDREVEFQTQFVEALEALATPDPVMATVAAAPVVTPPPAAPVVPEADVAAVVQRMNGSPCVVTTHGGKELYTFTGHNAWPAEFESNGKKYRLINGSYKKGIYQKV